MAKSRKSRSKRKGLGSVLSSKYFGNRKQSFGKKKRKSSKRREITVVLIAIVAMIGIVVGLIKWGVNRTAPENTADAVVSDNFDPIVDYAPILDKGNLEQTTRLLNALSNRRVDHEAAVVKLDTYKKIVEVSDKILQNGNHTESQRVRAASSKLNALWNSYYVGLTSGAEDPFMVDQLFGAADDFLDDEDFAVSRAAHMARTRGLAGETIGKRSLGSYEKMEVALIELLSKFPDDAAVLGNVRLVFTQLRAANSDQAVKLAAKITALTDKSDSDESRKLSRFLKDIILLYENGIGNLSKIASILVDEEDFVRRLRILNEDFNTGETVLVQLDNGIEFLERSRSHEAASEISQLILDSAEKRTDRDAAAMASWIGGNGLKRNKLIDSKWDFEETDEQGNEISNQRFTGRVALLVFFSQDRSNSRSILDFISGLAKLLAGREVQFVFIEVDEGGITTNNSNERKGNSGIFLQTRIDEPNRYLQQCPIKRFPYLVLIDKNGIVDSVNVSLSEVKTRIEHLMSRK